jgi:hypothetical protein
MHEVGPLVCDYFKIGQHRTLRWDFLEIAFLLTGLGFVQAKKNKKVISVPVDIGWLA